MPSSRNVPLNIFSHKNSAEKATTQVFVNEGFPLTLHFQSFSTMLSVLLLSLLGTSSAFMLGSAPHSGGVQIARCSSPAVSMELQPLRWAKGRVVATRNIFRKEEEKPDPVSMDPILDFAGSLAMAAASAAAATTSGAAKAIADVGPSPGA